MSEVPGVDVDGWIAHTGASNELIAKRADVAPSTVQRVRTGKVDPSIGTLAKIAAACDLALSVHTRSIGQSPAEGANEVGDAAITPETFDQAVAAWDRLELPLYERAGGYLSSLRPAMEGLRIVLSDNDNGTELDYIELARAAGIMTFIVGTSRGSLSRLAGQPNIALVTETPADAAKAIRVVADEVRRRLRSGASATRPGVLLSIHNIDQVVRDVSREFGDQGKASLSTDIERIMDSGPKTRVAAQFTSVFSPADPIIGIERADHIVVTDMDDLTQLTKAGGALSAYRELLLSQGGTARYDTPIIRRRGGNEVSAEYVRRVDIYSPAKLSPISPARKEAWAAQQRWSTEQISQLYPRLWWAVDRPDYGSILDNLYRLPIVLLDQADGQPDPKHYRHDPFHDKYVVTVADLEADLDYMMQGPSLRALQEMVIAHRTYFDVLGISDIETFDPREDWDANAHGGNLRIPIGYILDETFERTGDVQYLDFAEASIGGSGPSGMLQGTTGSGKSYLLVALVLTLARYFSPERVNFILMDFEGGATFSPVAGLPHVIANITDLQQEADLLDRAQDALRGEIIRREQLLRDAGAKDLLEYRKLRKANPHLEALPDLFIIADEFREFLALHREYVNLFESIAQTGRPLGMHLLLASQYFDASVIAEVLQNVLQNLTYGISLKVRHSSHSNTVIKNGAATSLPLGRGAAYLRKDVPEGIEGALTAFKTFNIGESYSADSDTAEPVGTDHETVSTVLARRLSEIADVSVPHQMWLPTLKAPLTVDEVTIPRANSMDQLRFRIGILDDPRNHKRVPYDIVPEDAGAHIRVAGAPGSGTSTTIEAIITAASLSYTPEQVQFYIIDCGSKLREVADFAHVGRYARRTDTEMIDRLLGEFLRMIEIRDEQFAERDVTSFSTYWESKQANPIADDPYGHMFLVIDQIHTFLSEDEDLVRRERLLRLLQNGGSRGLHVMVAGGAGSMGWHKLDPLFQLYVHHSTPDVNNSSITYRTMELKQQIKLIPHDQPGRILALAHGLQGRIMLPRVGPIRKLLLVEQKMWTYEKEVWNYKHDHGDAIRKLGQDIAARVGTRAPQINTVPAPLPVQDVWTMHRYRDAQRTLRPIPLGVSTEDLSLVSLPDTSTGASNSPHLIVAGDQQSGRTNMARWLLYSIMQQYTPDQAQIYLFDTTYGLISERDVLKEAGFLARYIADRTAAEGIVGEIVELVDSRRPNSAEDLKVEDLRDRSWYSGPEIFVIADPVTDLIGPNTYTPGPLDALAAVLDRRDLGLHLYLTAGAAHFARAKSSPFFTALEAAATPTLLLSGTTTEPIFGSAMTGGTIRFIRRQPGRGQFYDPSQSRHPIIQTPQTGL